MPLASAVPPRAPLYLLLAGAVGILISGGCRWAGAGDLQRWEQVRFDPAVPAALEVRVLEDPATGEGLDLVRVRLDGEVEAWFALDTGSGQAFLDDEVARRLGMPAEGTARLGACDHRVAFRRGQSFQLGRFRADDPLFVTLDLDPFLGSFADELGADVKVAGLIGYPVLRHAVVEMHYDAAGDAAFLYDPDGYELPRGTWQTMRLAGDGPVVDGRLEGARDALFFLDTGKSGTLSLSVPFIERERLLDGRPTEPAQNRRLCGVEAERAGTLAWVELGGQRFEQVPARFRLPGTDGGDTDRVADAVVGRELLKAFTVVFDYPHRRLALLPDASLADR